MSLAALMNDIAAALGAPWLERRGAAVDAWIARVALDELQGTDPRQRLALRFLGDALRELAAIVTAFDVVFESLRDWDDTEIAYEFREDPFGDRGR